jgi:hypothetical protein
MAIVLFTSISVESAGSNWSRKDPVADDGYAALAARSGSTMSRVLRAFLKHREVRALRKL